MKILYWTPLFWPEIGGIEIASAGLIRGLSDKKCEFVVLTSHGRLKLKDKEDYEGTPVYRFPLVSAFQNKDLRLIKHIINQVNGIKRSFQPDLTHINFGGPAPVSYLHLKTRKSSSIPALLTLHNSVRGMDCSPDTLMGEMFRTSDWVTACSEAMIQDARSLSPQISGRSSAVYYGLEMPELKPDPLPFTNPRILCIGRLVSEKGFDLALEALNTIKDRFPGLQMTVAGEGPSLPDLKKKADALGVSKRIEFTGGVERESVPELINRATLVFVPSRWREAFGLVALEAAQMGRPVVAARVGGLREVVEHKKTGILVEKENPAALVEAATYLLQHPDEAKRFGEAARRKARSLFSLEQYANSYQKIYKRLLSGKDS